MPFKVEKQGSQFVVKRADTGAVKSHHATRAKAEASMRAAYAGSSDQVRAADITRRTK